MSEHKYVCNDCGREFDTPAVEREDRGEFWGMPAYEEIGVCPYCRGDYEEIDERNIEE